MTLEFAENNKKGGRYASFFIVEYAVNGLGLYVYKWNGMILSSFSFFSAPLNELHRVRD